MQSPNSSVTPLRLRILEDIYMRQLAPKTQNAYLRAVRKLAAFTKKSSDTATSAEDLRRFQLHLVDAGTSPVSLNAAITGLTFFFDITLEQKVDIRVIQVMLGHKTLDADEFIRRFLLHVLPGGFHRIRHFGLLSNHGRKEKLARVRELLDVAPVVATQAIEASAEPHDSAVRATFVCAHCCGSMVIFETFLRGQAMRLPPLLARQQGPP